MKVSILSRKSDKIGIRLNGFKGDFRGKEGWFNRATIWRGRRDLEKRIKTSKIKIIQTGDINKTKVKDDPIMMLLEMKNDI